METIASIAPSLDRFFVDVLVNCPEEDLRRNRLALLGVDPEGVHEPRGLFRNRGGKMKRVYSFGNGVAEGAGLGKETLGGKGAGLAEMTALGIPVPPGFTIETSVCADVSRGASLDGIRAEVESALRKLEHDADKRFGDPTNPLLVSVRSGARSSMPGMMDTILNLGLTSRTVEGPRRALGRPLRASTAGAASSRCTATSCCACRATSSRRRCRRSRRRAASPPTRT